MGGGKKYQPEKAVMLITINFLTCNTRNAPTRYMVMPPGGTGNVFDIIRAEGARPAFRNPGA